MEAMEAGSRQSAILPSISSIDAEKSRRDDTDFQRKHSAAAMVSPSFPYSNPPPPYASHHAPAASAPPASLAGLISPPESRRTSGDEKEQKPPARQSLPSIHEALASEQPMPYPPHPTSTAPPPASQYFQPPPTSATSHPDSARRHFSQDFSSQQTDRSPYMKPPPQPPYSQAPQDPPRPTLPTTHNPKLPTLHPLRTEPSPVNNSRPPSFSAGYPYSQQQSPAYEQTPQQAAPVQPQQQPFGYNHPYPPAAYPYSAPPPPPPPSQVNPPYPPSAPAAYSASGGYPPTWRSDGAEVRRAEESKRAARNAGPALYGESVKRHLDNFDFEASLNEIAEGSGRLNEFLRIYGQRAHHAQRAGPLPGSTPAIHEVDELMKQSQRIVESLARIREVVLTTQQAHLAEQAQDPRFKAANGYEPEEAHNQYGEDPKGGGGFAGSDPKKRRGRAAPPGRCHSCNRAETPEWRRGPDGARTLCNACGLHYAKLTRKMGANKAPIGSSNLRPKSLGPGSPPA
ncbi:GATA zinc finger domain-containing protein 10 [Lasiodiplodia hormozganensis]|uniref:GATA zinc finger domain-containing protein 10 n=1 Tax=Lasiodiplodia hormozganensis TaxID=869390 RepID=A0AA39Y7F4_9PEZI|nr:GATA zinc finger domain-containing protein 10 [Lasiodiplodia hormozganensis]